MQAMSTQASSMPATPPYPWGNLNRIKQGRPIGQVVFHGSGRVSLEPLCPHCLTVVHDSYCGACDKLIEE